MKVSQVKYKAQIRLKDEKGMFSSWRDCDRISARRTYKEVASQINKIMVTFPQGGIFEIKLGGGSFQYRVVTIDTPSAENDWSISLNQILEDWYERRTESMVNS